jgi:hypothetical protein
MIIGQKVCTEVRWFAWYPVRIEDGTFAWLTYVYCLKDCFWGRYFCTYNSKPTKEQTMKINKEKVVLVIQFIGIFLIIIALLLFVREIMIMKLVPM